MSTIAIIFAIIGHAAVSKNDSGKARQTIQNVECPLCLASIYHKHE